MELITKFDIDVNIKYENEYSALHFASKFSNL